jgi:hypothetical protein
MRRPILRRTWHGLGLVASVDHPRSRFGKPVILRSIIAAGLGVGPTTLPASWKHWLNTPPGWTVCRTTCGTARWPRHRRRFAISVSANFRRSFRHPASAGTDCSPLSRRLAPVGPQELPPPRRCVSLMMGTQRRAGPPYGLPAQASTEGGSVLGSDSKLMHEASATARYATDQTRKYRGFRPRRGERRDG